MIVDQWLVPTRFSTFAQNVNKQQTVGPEGICPMSAAKKAALYMRVSTDSQTTENQLLELRAYASRMGYQIVAELSDQGISGTKGKKDLPSIGLVNSFPAGR
jgi:predicted site-specific integrase-resolvase